MRHVSSDTLTLVAICLTDLITTLFFMSCGVAYEANPLMAVALSYGVWAFVAVKLLSFVPFVVFIEIYSVKEPAKAKSITKLVSVVYLFIYIYVTVSANLQ